MAATIKGVTTLVFGCSTISTVITQSTDSAVSRDVTYAQGEAGEYVGFAIVSAGKCEASGEALYKGADIGTLAGTLTAIASPSGAGGHYLYEMSIKTTNTGFQRMSFKCAGVEGVS